MENNNNNKDNNIRFVSPLDDTTFKFLWKKQTSKNWFTKLIKYITTVDLDEYDLYDPELNSGNNLKDYRMDILFVKKDESKSINIEMYNTNRKVDQIKSSQYAFKLLGNRMEKGDNYVEHELVQVNFYNSYFKDDKNINIMYYLIKDESGKYEEKYLKRYDVYLPNYKGICYNETNELEAMLSFLSGESYEVLEKIANGNEEALKIVKDLEDLAMEEKYWGCYENNRRNKMMQNSLYDEGKEEGRKEGKEEGLKEGIEEVAKAMKENGYSKEEISKITKLSIEEIENIN